MASEAVERYTWWLGLSEAEFETAIQAKWAERRITEPFFWRLASANHPSQPVVGISWYEARAYCAWLSAQTGLRVRLPTEVEWEAAARGREGRRYAYGKDFDVLSCNVLSSRLHRATPVGVFVEGDTPEGVCDMAGNINEAISTALTDLDIDPDLGDPTFAYPYDPHDGREDPDPRSNLARANRGGSWNLGPVYARAARRGGNHPTSHLGDIGTRVVVEVEVAPG
jgi:formylglycine-generating enzyme required for sulfatase activity